MSFRKSLYRSALALVLLLGLMAAGGNTASVLHARQLATELRHDADKDAPVTAYQHSEEACLHTGRNLSPGHAEQGGRQFASRDFYLLPEIGRNLVSCSKSGLRRRLCTLLEHFNYPQRLSLYPKHGFW